MENGIRNPNLYLKSLGPHAGLVTDTVVPCATRPTHQRTPSLQRRQLGPAHQLHHSPIAAGACSHTRSPLPTTGGFPHEKEASPEELVG
jgi:hypothetical protein